MSKTNTTISLDPSYRVYPVLNQKGTYDVYVDIKVNDKSFLGAYLGYSEASELECWILIDEIKDEIKKGMDNVF